MLMHNPPHPGELLQRLYMEPLGLTISGLASALGVSRGTLSQVVNGRARLTPNMAVRLSRAFRNTAEGWLNMQQQFDLWHESRRMRRVKIEALWGARRARARAS
jgi:addiction module HigA family antidote